MLRLGYLNFLAVYFLVIIFPFPLPLHLPSSFQMPVRKLKAINSVQDLLLPSHSSAYVHLYNFLFSLFKNKYNLQQPEKIASSVSTHEQGHRKLHRPPWLPLQGERKSYACYFHPHELNQAVLSSDQPSHLLRGILYLAKPGSLSRTGNVLKEPSRSQLNPNDPNCRFF